MFLEQMLHTVRHDLGNHVPDGPLRVRYLTVAEKFILFYSFVKKVLSHYHWKNGNEIVAHCTVEGLTSMFEINVDSGETKNLYLPYFDEEGNPDIHCNYSADRRYIIGDG